MAANQMSEEDRRALWAQFVDVYAKAQESYDSSVRTLAAAGVAVTVSLATALKSLPGTGIAAVIAFLGSLALGIASHVTAQRDMIARLGRLKAYQTDGLDRNTWTTATAWLNVFAGLAWIAGGILLAIYIASRT